MPALTPFQTIEHPYSGTHNHPFTGSSNGRVHNSIFSQYTPRSNQTFLYRDQMTKSTSTATQTQTQTQNQSQTTSEKKQKSKPKSFFFSIQPQDQIDSQVSKMSSNTSSSIPDKTRASQQQPQQKPYAPSLYAESTMSTSTTKTTKPLLKTTSNSSNTSSTTTSPTQSKRKTTGFRHKTKKFLSSLGEPPTAAWEREQALARADAAASEQGTDEGMMDEKTKREKRIEEQRRVQLAFAMDYGPMSRGGPWNGRSTFT